MNWHSALCWRQSESYESVFGDNLRIDDNFVIPPHRPCGKQSAMTLFYDHTRDKTSDRCHKFALDKVFDITIADPFGFNSSSYIMTLFASGAVRCKCASLYLPYRLRCTSVIIRFHTAQLAYRRDITDIMHYNLFSLTRTIRILPQL